MCRPNVSCLLCALVCVRPYHPDQNTLVHAKMYSVVLFVGKKHSVNNLINTIYSAIIVHVWTV